MDSLSEEQALDLLHLLDCPACQGLVRQTGLEDSVGRSGGRPAYDRLWQDLEVRMPGLVKEMEERTAEAQRLMDRLLGSPAAERHALAGTADFRNLKLADLLLLESGSLQPAEPALSEERARLAFCIAAQPFERELAGRVDEVKARASVLIAGARRLAGDRVEAEDGFRRAAAYLTCPPDAAERAFYCQHLALLRRDQGREDEASGLLWRAALVYNENADLLEEAACLAELGFLFLAEDQIHRAVLPLTRACEVLDLYRDATLAVRARLALAVCHAGLGHEAKALRLLKATRPMYSRVASSALQMAHITWMEGKVALLTGNLGEAPDLLDSARDSFLRLGRLYDAAFVTLDLAAVLSRAGRLESLHPLIHDIVESFPADVGQAGVLRALGSVEAALARGRRAEVEDDIAAAVQMLRGFRRNPLLAFAGLPNAAKPGTGLNTGLNLGLNLG
jgi:tetratricopeptide (TPR) repeat protein